MADLQHLLERTAALHSHLCPRQVLGVRAGLLAAQLFDLDLPQSDKRLFAFVETDGCFVDGVTVASGCTLGKRTLRLVDYGKVAVTFADTIAGTAYRLAPLIDVRDRCAAYAPDALRPWDAQLRSYQIMPDAELLSATRVTLNTSLKEIISHPGLRVPCSRCGEEIMNAREVIINGVAFCGGCASSERYYSD